jgi:hypothetical protein
MTQESAALAVSSLPTLTAMRYVMPLREGGSLPAIIEADDGALYVMKFVGAGQGAKALTAEVIAGGVGLALGLNIPPMVLLNLDPRLGRSEPNPDVQDLLRASSGLNLGHRYLPGSFAYNVLIQPPPPPDEASAIVWFDSYVTNVDRTARNVNMLLAEGKLWLIDHGAALYFHHNWGDVAARSLNTFPMVREHTLLRFASRLAEVDAPLRARLDDATLRAIVATAPDVWMESDSSLGSPEQQREAYFTFLRMRRDGSAHFVEEALHARAAAGF